MVLAAVVVVVVAVEEEHPDLPDIWKVVEGSYDSHVIINFPDLVSLKACGAKF